MQMKALSYTLFLLFTFLLLYLVSRVDHRVHPVTISSEALHPDILLGNVVVYTREHAYQRSLVQLREAIKSMKGIEEEVDEEGKEAIEQAISELNLVYKEIESGNLINEDLRRAMTKAFSALTVAELRVTEAYVASDKKSDAMIALGYGKVHLKNAMKFADQETFNDELEIYTVLDRLKSNENVSDEEILTALNKALVSLDQLQEK